MSAGDSPGSSLMCEAVHHVALKAADVERVVAFYRDVLGLPEERRHDDDQGLRSVWLSCGGVLLMVERASTPATVTPDADAAPPGLHLLAFRIRRADREAWRARLTARGHAVASETEHTLYAHDPEGNRVGLSCWGEV